MEEHKSNIKGIRIRTVNMVMLVLSLIIFVMVLYTTVRISHEYNASVKATEDYIKWEKAAGMIHVGSDYLTEHARLYVQTTRKEYADNYFFELYRDRMRERALEYLSQNGVAHPLLEKALELSNALTNHELYAIRLTADAIGQDLVLFPAELRQIRLSEADRLLAPQAKIERAREIMFNDHYLDVKKKIVAILEESIDQNLELTRSWQHEKTDKLGKALCEQRIGIIILCLLSILTFSMISVLIVKPLQVYLKCIKDDRMFEIVGAYEFKHLALTYNDIFAIKEHHDRMLRHKAEHDPLTGLLNRGAFESLRELFRQERQPVGLLLVDVDKFKEVNDTYGHVAGDKALCRVATLLRGSFRSDDYCIRLGGDEFAVILHGKLHGMGQIIMEKIESINKELQNPPEGQPPLSISVGVAFSESGFADNLYDSADKALYEVKEAGRRGCGFYGGAN